MITLRATLVVGVVFLCAASGAAPAARSAPANSLTYQPTNQPSEILPPVDEELCPGEILPFQVGINPPPAPVMGDIVFAFDTTGSMGGVIHAAQTNALIIMQDLNNLISDLQFGVIDMEDYPVDPYGIPGVNEAYRLRQRLTYNQDAIWVAINALAANQGGDLPETYTRVIHEAYSDSRIGWRENSRHLLLVFGDSVAHDDDLNEDIPYPQPHMSGYRWITGIRPELLDPGRDGIPGTDDDLDFQTEVRALGDNSITLLSIVTSSTFPDPTQGELVTYWNTWAGWTGGKSVALWNAHDLPELIREIVEDTVVGIIRRVALETEPELYGSWVYSDPVEIRDLPIPTDGEVSFLGRVTAPSSADTGRYHFRILVVGDGIVYGEVPVTIRVPPECFPQRENPWWYYLPLITKRHIGAGSDGR
jgi:hypothetical protein